MMAPKKYDVAGFTQLLKVFSQEKPREMEARLRMEEADAIHQRSMEKARLWATMGVVGVAAAVCIWVILSPHTSSERQHWASTLLTAIVTSVVSYMVGKETK